MLKGLVSDFYPFCRIEIDVDEKDKGLNLLKRSDTPADSGGYDHSRSWFTFQELYGATSGFSDDKLLGEGGFGRVYKGLLSNGKVVAVKQLKVGGGPREREFKEEVEIISRIHHND